LGATGATAATAALATLGLPALAQTKTVLRISTPAVPDDWHAKMWTVFKDALKKLRQANLTYRST
jgi:ABC-type sugar transport system substrate-binding protein